VLTASLVTALCAFNWSSGMVCQRIVASAGITRLGLAMKTLILSSPVRKSTAPMGPGRP
jgi:hypothetical protein